ncbi:MULTISPECIES: DUF3006 domain-containing protein [Lysinibacillus]|uniref:DUF3006 domain-containing protein n=1 Tax=Lysinibacillus antri TaxID=2498145 RepID=A0A3S0WIA4_9BACI|nr:MULTISPECIES: DUF3006 domain-containing protein [Lysinibacillus]RUL56373.1 DUF3006 domain-containing protein [Lysinibacillus antri]TSI07047.1 DUF3006 domain-containing protein [Lysinibacillus sp. BW-2-10]
MNSNKYTLDRFEGDYAIFLKRPEEVEQVIIHKSEIHVQVKEGDIVQINDDGEDYDIQVLSEDTSKKSNMIQNLLNELKNSNNNPL